MTVEHVFDIRYQLAQIGAEAGCKNDRVEFLACRIGKHNAIWRKAIDPAAYFDGTVSDPVQCADIDQRYASILLHHLARSFGRAAQSQLFDGPDSQPQDRSVDKIDQPRGQAPIQDRPCQDWKA